MVCTCQMKNPEDEYRELFLNKSEGELKEYAERFNIEVQEKDSKEELIEKILTVYVF